MLSKSDRLFDSSSEGPRRPISIAGGGTTTTITGVFFVSGFGCVVVLRDGVWSGRMEANYQMNGRGVSIDVTVFWIRPIISIARDVRIISAYVSARQTSSGYAWYYLQRHMSSHSILSVSMVRFFMR